jgi:hypothetical protein
MKKNPVETMIADMKKLGASNIAAKIKVESNPVIPPNAVWVGFAAVRERDGVEYIDKATMTTDVDATRNIAFADDNRNVRAAKAAERKNVKHHLRVIAVAIVATDGGKAI